jgi:hypothetical protein
MKRVGAAAVDGGDAYSKDELKEIISLGGMTMTPAEIDDLSTPRPTFAAVSTPASRLATIRASFGTRGSAPSTATTGVYVATARTLTPGFLRGIPLIKSSAKPGYLQNPYMEMRDEDINALLRVDLTSHLGFTSQHYVQGKPVHLLQYGRHLVRDPATLENMPADTFAFLRDNHFNKHYASTMQRPLIDRIGSVAYLLTPFTRPALESLSDNDVPLPVTFSGFRWPRLMTQGIVALVPNKLRLYVYTGDRNNQNIFKVGTNADALEVSGTMIEHTGAGGLQPEDVSVVPSLFIVGVQSGLTADLVDPAAEKANASIVICMQPRSVGGRIYKMGEYAILGEKDHATWAFGKTKSPLALVGIEGADKAKLEATATFYTSVYAKHIEKVALNSDGVNYAASGRVTQTSAGSSMSWLRPRAGEGHTGLSPVSGHRPGRGLGASLRGLSLAPACPPEWELVKLV